MVRVVVKRLLDIIISVFGIVLLSPLFLVIFIVVVVCMGFPPIFKQKRPGYLGKPITLYKFRTMTNDRGPDGQFLPDQDRLTRLGRFLRSTSLDELPELFNVLKGDMSLVGPRPLLMQYLDRYTPEQARRHEMKPGITGWAQVNGRNAISWEEKFALDVWYVDNWSLWLDIKILALTVWKVICREGISSPDEATMYEFMGSGDAQITRNKETAGC